jgi:hypothetical protein
MELGDRLKLGITAVACAAGLALCGSASASVVTLGETASVQGTKCQAGDFYTMASPATPSYTIPVGGGAIDKWSTATFDASAGAPITLLVLEPSEGGSPYELAAFDTEALPTEFQLDNQATFTPSAPIEVPAGAVLGLWSSAASEECSFADAANQAANQLTSGTSPAPVDGATYTGFTGGQRSLNVSAELVQGVDAGLSIGTPPTSSPAGAVAAFNFSLTSAGPSSDRTTVSDTVPKGLSIVAAISGSGSCSVTGQVVTCTTESIAPGSRTPISILVRTSVAGSFTDTASVASSTLPDPNGANNVASANLTVTSIPAAARSCQIVALKGLSLRTAKALLRDLSCAIGKVSKKSSTSVRKGDVISTSPGSGSRRAGTKVAIVESSGKPRHRG